MTHWWNNAFFTQATQHREVAIKTFEESVPDGLSKQRRAMLVYTNARAEIGIMSELKHKHILKVNLSNSLQKQNISASCQVFFFFMVKGYLHIPTLSLTWRFVLKATCIQSFANYLLQVEGTVACANTVFNDKWRERWEGNGKESSDRNGKIAFKAPAGNQTWSHQPIRLMFYQLNVDQAMTPTILKRWWVGISRMTNHFVRQFSQLFEIHLL